MSQSWRGVGIEGHFASGKCVHMIKLHLLRVSAVAGVAAIVLAGCQSKDPTAVLAADGTASAGTQKISAEELRASCPKVQLREGTATLRKFAKGGEDDPTKLVYLASIADVTRACTYPDGGVTVNVALAGRVVNGPAGAGGQITLPIRIAATRGSEVVYSQLHQYTVALGGGTTQFVFNDPAVVIPGSVDGSVQVFAGFDEGPAAKKKPADAESN